MKKLPAHFEKAVADFQHDAPAARLHRDALDRGNAGRNETRARFRDWPVVRAAAAAIRDADVRQMEKRLTDFAARFEGPEANFTGRHPPKTRAPRSSTS